MSCGSAGMGLRNIAVKRNGTFRESWTFTDEANEAIDLTGYAFELQVRPVLGGATAIFTVTTTANANDSVITVTDATAGEIEVFISNGDIDDIPAASDISEAVSYTYDLVLTDPDGDFNPYVGGAFTVIPGVSE